MKPEVSPQVSPRGLKEKPIICFSILKIYPRPILCLASRGKQSKFNCEKPALHRFSHPLFEFNRDHAARNRFGHWYFWR